MRNLLTPLLLALAVAAGALALTGCGGGESSEAAAANAKPANPAQDCSNLDEVATDLVLAAATDGGLDFVRYRDFMDGYAERAPEQVADSVERLRDFLAEYADAAEDVGLKAGDAPLPDQIDAIIDELDVSEDEQAENARALQTISTWVSNGCGS
jgi:hypothetical protein